jgi:hypothetical protein
MFPHHNSSPRKGQNPKHTLKTLAGKRKETPKERNFPLNYSNPDTKINARPFSNQETVRFNRVWASVSLALPLSLTKMKGQKRKKKKRAKVGSKSEKKRTK